jgi:hypothetical protein
VLGTQEAAVSLQHLLLKLPGAGEVTQDVQRLGQVVHRREGGGVLGAELARLEG